MKKRLRQIIGATGVLGATLTGQITQDVIHHRGLRQERIKNWQETVKKLCQTHDCQINPDGTLSLKKKKGQDN